jgi:hypothetical protein
MSAISTRLCIASIAPSIHYSNHAVHRNGLARCLQYGLALR